MPNEKSDEKTFDKLPKETQDRLKGVAEEKDIHHIKAFESAVKTYPLLPAPDACHRYIEDHRASH